MAPTRTAHVRSPRSARGVRSLAAVVAGAVLATGALVLGPVAPAGAISDTQTDVGADVNCNLNGLHQGTGPVSTCRSIDVTTSVLVNGSNVATGSQIDVGDVITVSVVVPPRGGNDAMYQETVDGIRNNQYDIEARISVGLPPQTGTLLSTPTSVTMSRTDNGDRGNGPAINCLAHNGQDAPRSDPPSVVTFGNTAVGSTKMRADLASGTITGRWTEMSADRCVNVLSNNGYYAGFTLTFTQTVLSRGATATAPTWNFGKVTMARKDGSRSIGWGATRAGTLAIPATPPVATVPGAPTIGAAVAGNASAQLSWTAPANNGGSPITGYVVTPIKGFVAQAPVTFNSTATTQTISGLDNGAAYTFRVAAKNAVGTGAQSAASNSVTPTAPQTVPGAPTIGAATAGNASAEVSWTAPADNGGAPINGYIVTPYVGAVAQTPRAFAGTATTRTVTGLTNGTIYTFRVAATNVLGTGAQSAPSNAVTPVAPLPAWHPFPNADAFTRQQFLDLAGRQPSNAELTTWREALQSGTPPGQLIEGLRGGAYWEGQLGPIVRLYTAVFLRTPDTPGMEFWEARYRGGQSLTSIATFFASSQEFQQRYGSLNDAQFVTLIYQNVLVRAPDEDGFDFWTGELAKGVTRGKVVAHFSNSNEYKAKTSDRVKVITAYYGMLERVPTTAEVTAGVAVLTGGGSIEDLLTTILRSPEYAERVL